MAESQGNVAGSKVLKILKNNMNAPKTIIIIVVVYGFAELLETKDFYSCPETGYYLYGLLFLIAPGACFSVLALLMNAPFWTSVTGCCHEKADSEMGKSKKAEGQNVKRCFWMSSRVCRKTTHALFISAFVFLVWIVIAFASTNFYVCFKLGPEPSDAPEDIKEKFGEKKAESTKISFWIFSAFILVVLIYTAFHRCYVKGSKRSFLNIDKYEKLKWAAAVEMFQTQMALRAKLEGEAQVDVYLDEVKKKEKTVDKIIENAPIELMKTKCHPRQEASPVAQNSGIEVADEVKSS